VVELVFGGGAAISFARGLGHDKTKLVAAIGLAAYKREIELLAIAVAIAIEERSAQRGGPHPNHKCRPRKEVHDDRSGRRSRNLVNCDAGDRVT